MSYLEVIAAQSVEHGRHHVAGDFVTCELSESIFEEVSPHRFEELARAVSHDDLEQP